MIQTEKQEPETTDTDSIKVIIVNRKTRRETRDVITFHEEKERSRGIFSVFDASKWFLHNSLFPGQKQEMTGRES